MKLKSITLGAGIVSLGLGSSVDQSRQLTGKYSVIHGRPNTRLAGIDIIKI